MSKYAPHARSKNNPRAGSSTVCQKCLQPGHFTYQCKNDRPYVSRPSRTQQLENPRKIKDTPSVQVPEEFKNKSGTANRILDAREKERSEAKANKRHKQSDSSSSDSDSSVSDNSDSESESESDSSRSRERDAKRRRPTKKSMTTSRSRSPGKD